MGHAGHGAGNDRAAVVTAFTRDDFLFAGFADQVMVMYEGELVQTGTPQELFENPKHKFVGFFIGSPGMNFIDCTVEGIRESGD